VTAFADSSALVKLYADEPHADLVRAHELLVVAAVARVEVASALWRKVKMGELSATSASILVDAWDLDWHEAGGRFAVVGLTDEVLEGAVALCARYSLRAYDAMQLASAVAARQAEESVDTFLCFDVELRDAAAREGFAG
jgi:predicted nucleic acid-binding protein